MLTAARVMFLAFFNICLFKKKPQEIPESAALLAICVFFYLAISTLLVSFTEAFHFSLLSALLEIGVLSLFVFALLKVTAKNARWTQTMTALCGTGVVLSVIALPVYLVMGFYAGNNTENDPVYTSLLLVLAGLALWNIAIMAHILRHALEIGTFTSVMLAISYIWIILTISASLFPSELN